VTENVSRLGERLRDASGVPIVVHYGQVVRRKSYYPATKTPALKGWFR